MRIFSEIFLFRKLTVDERKRQDTKIYMNLLNLGVNLPTANREHILMNSEGLYIYVTRKEELIILSSRSSPGLIYFGTHMLECFILYQVAYACTLILNCRMQFVTTICFDLPLSSFSHSAQLK